MKKLSIVILNYNTKKLLAGCLKSLERVKREVSFEIIVCDNGSKDGSGDYVKKNYPNVKLVENGENLGFAKGNNKARPFVDSEYVLFLNSDTIVHKNTLKETVDYLDKDEKVGAITCKILLPDGRMDKDARRAFITPWIGLVHIFLKMDRLFPKSKIFAKYWYGYISPDETHEIDALQGAYFLTRKKLLDKVGWFDEDYFLDAEDIDLSWRIKKKGYKNVYYPKVSITHLKGYTKGKIENANKKNVPLKSKLKYRLSGVESMGIFYKKRLWLKYPIIVNLVVLLGINILKFLRFAKTVILG